jgi:hypothetical protein
MVDFNELKKFIQTNHEEFSAILDTERLSVINAAEVKILHGKYLTDFWKERPNKNLTYVLSFNEELITALNFDSIKNNLATVIPERLKTHRSIQVDSEFAVITYTAAEIIHDSLIEMSNKKNVVFFFGEAGIDVVVRGKIFPRINVFYDEADRIKYSKNFHISELQECLKEYEKFINEPGINEAFFASKVVVKKIQPIDPPKNTLINKPENTLRNNLRVFLNRNTQHDFSRENELNNKRELDLYTEVEGRKYLIEVKWLGQTVNDTETGFTQRVTDISARDGVTQTLEYIQELIEKMSYNVHCGYLCVFDARETKKPVNYDNYKFVQKELMPYFTKHFIKLDEIAVERTH